jgi:EmrB/QacA subfamily drug resistance transporter
MTTEGDIAMNDKTAYERRWWTLAVLSLSLLVVGLDNTILNVALPSLRTSLDATSSQLQWIVDSYMLVFAGILLTAGSLGDRFGRKRALQLGLLVFGAGSVIAAFSVSSTMLIASRSLMGAGAAFIMPSTLSILTNVFPAGERAKAIGIWAGVSGLGIVIGPVTGGFLLEHFWWGSVFLVNGPFVVLTLVAARSLVPESRDPAAPRLDPAGAGISIVALTTLLWGIIEAPSHGWTSPVILAAFVASAVTAAVFVAWELRTASPMLDVRFFLNPRFTAASVSIALVFFALFGTIFFLTQYLQSVLGFSTLAAGVRVIPFAFAMMPAAAISPKLAARFGTKLTVTAGLLAISGGLGLLTLATDGTGYGLVAASLLVTGLGMGLAMAPATDSIMGALPLEKASVGSAMNDTTRMVGGSLGVAIMGSVLSSVYAAHVPASAGAVAQDSVGGAMAVAASTHDEALAQAASHAFVSGMTAAALVGTIVAVAGALLAFFLLPNEEREGTAVRVPAVEGT